MFKSPAGHQMVLLILVAGSWGPANSQTDQQYCDKFGSTHTMCKYPTATRGCASEPFVTDQTIIDDIVNTHNTYRQKVANGQEGSQPSASNMCELVWNEELAKIAQRWADQCAFSHDSNRLAFGFPESVGQNIAGESWITFENRSPTFGSVVIPGWYREVKSFDPNTVNSYKGDAGHYAQMIWANTCAVGCGYVYYKSDNSRNKFYVCNYGPSGNFVGDVVYKTGPPCSACESGGTCSSKYNGLCTSSAASGDSST